MSPAKNCYICVVRKAKIQSDGIPICEVCAEEHLIKEDVPDEEVKITLDADKSEKWIDLGILSGSTENLFEDDASRGTEGADDWDDDKTPVLRKS